jgi:hypothetical protein
MKKWTPKCSPRITGFLYFVHRPVFYILGNTTFLKLDLFPPSDEEEIRTLLGPLERANLSPMTAVSSPSSEDGNRSSFRNVFLVSRIPDDVQSPKPQKF